MIPKEDKIRQQKGETGNTYIVLSMLLDDSYMTQSKISHADPIHIVQKIDYQLEAN